MTDEKSVQDIFNEYVYVSSAILPGKWYGRVYGGSVMHPKIIRNYEKPLPGSKISGFFCMIGSTVPHWSAKVVLPMVQKYVCIYK